jgi:hypothetical protein
MYNSGFILLLLISLQIAACGQNEDTGGCRADELIQVPFGEEDTTFHIGPYIGHTTQTTVAVGWETVESGDTRLEYGLDDTYGQTVSGQAGTMHQVVVEDLTPQTLFHYRACTNDRCSQDLMFSTAPKSGRPFSFVVYGDNQSNPEVHRKVAEQMLTDSPILILSVGDTVSDGDVREQYKERYFDPIRFLTHFIPRYAAPGNHDRRDLELVNFRDYNMFPEQPGVHIPEATYSFTYGDAFFIVLDNTTQNLEFFWPIHGTEWPLWIWLNEQVTSPAAQQARWRFLVAHYPATSACYEEGHQTWIQEAAMKDHVLPLLWENNFQAYFNGHQHCYERFDFDGHLVITTGGGGGGLEPQEQCIDSLPEGRVHECIHHHVGIELGCEQAKVWAKDMDGNVIDSFVLFPDGHIELE